MIFGISRWNHVHEGLGTVSGSHVTHVLKNTLSMAPNGLVVGHPNVCWRWRSNFLHSIDRLVRVSPLVPKQSILVCGSPTMGLQHEIRSMFEVKQWNNLWESCGNPVGILWCPIEQTHVKSMAQKHCTAFERTMKSKSRCIATSRCDSPDSINTSQTGESDHQDIG